MPCRRFLLLATAIVAHEMERLHGPRPPRRRVALVGPHDRFNFGDLLFEKVVTHLLLHRAGYQPTELLSVGMITTNMSAYGGNPHIVSMKAMSERSQLEAAGPNGPYDMVFLGGEAAGCTYAVGKRMLQTPELQVRAEAEKTGYDMRVLSAQTHARPRGMAPAWRRACAPGLRAQLDRRAHLPGIGLRQGYAGGGLQVVSRWAFGERARSGHDRPGLGSHGFRSLRNRDRPVCGRGRGPRPT